ncbi:unnamed protein product [Owenia fusiformis]|uniref:Uncharacterized protein n=1 Tax=Owenia fusiformis TaxID=6347 RepID=A0A8J1TF34_OWEFU|nr:unnamed protein product [Owenia fusiformis]
MKLVVLFLACLVGVSKAVVDIEASDLTVSCGTEDSVLGFGPIIINVMYTPESWDSTTGSNATVYPQGYEHVVDLGVDCIETIDVSASPWNYTLEIKQAPLAVGDEGACGQERLDAQTIQVELVVREGDIANSDDMYFNIQCVYKATDLVGLGKIIEGGVPSNPDDVVATATPNALDRKYELQLMYGDGDSENTVTRGEVLIGTEVYLRALMYGEDLGTVPPAIAGDENSIRIISCTACNDLNANCFSLFADYCPVLGIGAQFQSDSGFVTVASGTLSRSPDFKMFTIGGGQSAKVKFTCEIEVCRIADQCDGQNCETASRKKRALAKRQATDALAGTTYVTFEVDVVAEESDNAGNAGANSGTNTNTISGDSNLMYIILGIVGGLVLLCLIAGLIVFMRMRNNKDDNEKTIIQHHHNSHYANGGYKA